MEPGPVVSSILENQEVWTQKYENPTADQKTTEQFQNYRLRFNDLFQKGIRNADEVAEIVKNIILCDKPNLRYLTNDKYNVDVVKAKLSDLTGNDMVDLVIKKYFGKE